MTPQDGGEPITVMVPAEAGTEYEITGLRPETTYDTQIDVVIDTEGSEETYDIGVPGIVFETSKSCYDEMFFVFYFYLFCLFV